MSSLAPTLGLLVLAALALAGSASPVAGSASPVADSATRLRLMTYNVHAWRDSAHVDNLERLIELVNRIDPDVLCLNEVLHPFAGPPADDPYWSEVLERRGHGLEPPAGCRPASDAPEAYLNRLVRATGLEHCAFVAANEAGCFFGRLPFGNAILSRHRLRGVQSRVLQVTADDLTLGSQARTEADLEPRSALTAIVEAPGGAALGVCCTHLDHKAEELRERQIGEAIAFSDAALGVPHIICGDLNTFGRDDLSPEAWDGVCQHYASAGWPPPPEESMVLRQLAAQGYEDAFANWRRSCATATGHAPLTCWTQKPLFRLDYVLLSPGGWTVLDHCTLDSSASDHFPVVVELELDGGPAASA